MELQFYKYTCDCGNVFKALHLLGSPYGQFLLKSETDELAYLDAPSSREFNELNKIVDTYFPLDDREDIDSGDVMQDLFSVVCDLSPQKKIYFLNKHPNCPQCHSPYQIKSWIDVYPPEIVTVDIKEITCEEWNGLSKPEKIKLVGKGLEIALSKSMEIMHESDLSLSWTTLSSSEAVKKIVSVENKNFKRMLSAFRKLRGLDPASPIDNISLNENPK